MEPIEDNHHGALTRIGVFGLVNLDIGWANVAERLFISGLVIETTGMLVVLSMMM